MCVSVWWCITSPLSFFFFPLLSCHTSITGSSPLNSPDTSVSYQALLLLQVVIQLMAAVMFHLSLADSCVTCNNAVNITIGSINEPHVLYWICISASAGLPREGRHAWAEYFLCFINMCNILRFNFQTSMHPHWGTTSSHLCDIGPFIEELIRHFGNEMIETSDLFLYIKMGV